MTNVLPPSIDEPVGDGSIVFLDGPEVTADDFYALYGPGPAVSDEGEYITAAANIDSTTGEVHTGAMVALVPTVEDAERLAYEGGEPVDQLHLTMIYLGDAADVDDETRVALLNAMTDIARQYNPVEANAFSLNVFNPLGEEPCVVIGVGGAVLDEIHELIVSACSEAGADTSLTKVPWVPHVTVAYAEPPIEAVNVGELAGQRMGELSFDRIRVAFGGETHDFELRIPSEQ